MRAISLPKKGVLSVPVQYVVVLWAFVLRLVRIGDHIAFDEIYTAYTVRMSWGGIIRECARDVHPPLFYFIEKVFVSILGENAFSLRLPSVLLGTLLVWLVYRLGQRLASHRAALIAASLVAISPFCVFYSNESRMYMLLAVAVVAAIIGALDGRGWLMAVGAGSAVLSHNMAVAYLPVIGLIAWERLGFKRAAGWLTLGMLPWAAWVPLALGQMSVMSSDGYWIEAYTGVEAMALIRQLSALLFFRTLDWTLWQTFIITTAMIVFPLSQAIIHRDRGALLAAAVAFAPALVELVISVAWQPMLLYRTLAGSLPAWLILIGWWLALPRRWTIAQAGLLVLCLAIGGASLGRYYAQGRNPVGDDVMAWIAHNIPPEADLCHGDPGTEYHLGREAHFEFERCDYLLWEGDLWWEQAHIEEVDALLADGALVEVYDRPIPGPFDKHARVYVIKQP